MSVQVIEKNGKPEWAVVPYEEYQRLLEEAEMLQDIRAYDEAKLSVAQGEELADAYGERNSIEGELVVRVKPTKIIAKNDVAARSMNPSTQLTLERIVMHIHNVFFWLKDGLESQALDAFTKGLNSLANDQ